MISFNPFSSISKKIYYASFARRVVDCMNVLAGDENRLGVLDYLLVLPMLAKLSNFSENLITRVIITFPKMIVSFFLALILSPIIFPVHLYFNYQYKKELNKIGSLTITPTLPKIPEKNNDITPIENKREHPAATSKSTTNQINKKLIDLIKNLETGVNEYLVLGSAFKNQNSLVIYPAQACYCGAAFDKPHEPSIRLVTDGNTNIEYKSSPLGKIPISEENELSIRAIFKVSAFFSNDSSLTVNNDNLENETSQKLDEIIRQTRGRRESITEVLNKSQKIDMSLMLAIILAYDGSATAKQKQIALDNKEIANVRMISCSPS